MFAPFLSSVRIECKIYSVAFLNSLGSSSTALRISSMSGFGIPTVVWLSPMFNLYTLYYINVLATFCYLCFLPYYSV